MYASEDGEQCFEDKIAFRAMQVIQAIDPDAASVKGRYDVDVIKEIVAQAFPRGRGKPDWNYINNQLKEEYPMVDVARLKAVLASPVSADETKDKKVVAPIELYSGNKIFKRGTPTRQAAVADGDLNKDKNKSRFSVVTKYTTVVNGQTHYWLVHPDGRREEVDISTWASSKYKPVPVSE